MSNESAAAAAQKDPNEHLGALIGTGASIAALLLLLRVMAVAHWDFTVAGHILDAFDFGSAASVAVGTLFANAQLAALVVSLMTPVAVLALITAISRRTSVFAALGVAVLSCALLASLALSEGLWWGPVIAAVLSVGLFLVLRLSAHGKLGKSVRWVVARLGSTILLGLVVLVVFVQEPWASAELITLTDGSVHTLYVLSESPSGMHALVPGGDVTIIMNSEILSRTFP